MTKAICFTSLKLGSSADVVSALHSRIACLVVFLVIFISSALNLSSANQAESKQCQFYENPFSQDYIVQLREYNDLKVQEQLTSRSLSSTMPSYGLKIVKRSVFAHQAPTDFVVFRLSYCGVKTIPGGPSTAAKVNENVCHGFEKVMQNYAKKNDTEQIKSVQVNKEYRKLQLLGLDEQRSQGHKLQTVASKRTVIEPAIKSHGLRKEATLLVDDLNVRKLWKRGFKGQGVKIGIFDSGLSSRQVRNVKESINWTHETKNTDLIGHGTFVAGVISGTNAKCLGIAPEAELFVFRMFTGDHLSFTSWYLDAFNYALFKKINVLNLSTGGPDFLDIPFVDKVQELTANGIILVSAVGNDGPHYGLLTNPADQPEVIGVGGITKTNEIAEFSSRGMTTWEFPFGSGRVKPDLVTIGEDVPGADASGGCKVLSGTSASAPIVSASIAVLASIIPAEKRWELLNPASIKQILLQSSDKLVARYDSEYVIRNHLFEQGSGVLNISRASEKVERLWSQYQTAQSGSAIDHEVISSVLKPSAFPREVNMTDCPHTWPYCHQPLYHSALPLTVNLTILNPTSLVGTIKSPTQWISGPNGDFLTVSTSSPSVLWPYFGWIGIFIDVNEQAATFEGIAQGTVRLEIHSGGHVNELLIPIIIKIVPTPPTSKRILWDQFHQIFYPSAFVPRDNLDNEHHHMDVAGDHPHTNFQQMWNFLLSEGFFVEILPFEYSCIELNNYGVVLVVDPEEDFFQDEIVALQTAIKSSNVSLMVFADWYDKELVDAMELFDTSTLSKWNAITGGANIPTINKLLQDFQITFGNRVVHSSSVSLLEADNPSSFPYWSGSYLINFPMGGYLGYIDAMDQSAKILNGSENTLTRVPVLGLYEVPSQNAGRIAVFGDSSCLDSSVHPAAKFRHCFGLLRTILHFTNDAILPVISMQQNDSELHRLELDFITNKSDGQSMVDLQDLNTRARHKDFAKHSKVPPNSSIPRSYCKYYAKKPCR